MTGCPCSSTQLVKLATNVQVKLTEFPGYLTLNLYQCNKCGAILAEDVDSIEQEQE